MFIEKLWEENPELVIKAVKKIFDVREEKGDRLEFVEAGNGALRFKKYGHCSFGIVLTDFEVYGQNINSGYNVKWMKFIYNEFGDVYIYQYIAYRNSKLDKFMAEYENKFNDETVKTINQLGFEMNNGKTK